MKDWLANYKKMLNADSHHLAPPSATPVIDVPRLAWIGNRVTWLPAC